MYCSCLMSASQLAENHHAKALHACDSLAPHSARLQELDGFRREAVQLYLSFINLTKLKTLYGAMKDTILF